MNVRKFVLGLACSTLISTGAAATDIPQPMAPAIAPPPPPAAVFDWAGLYVGGYAGVSNYVPWFEGLALAGYNVVLGRVLVGADLRVGIYLPGPSSPVAFQIGPGVRAGLLLGDRALAYTRLAGHFIPGWGWAWSAALGGEFAVTPAVALFAEVQTLLPVYGVNVLGGIVWRPGR